MIHTSLNITEKEFAIFTDELSERDKKAISNLEFLGKIKSIKI